MKSTEPKTLIMASDALSDCLPRVNPDSLDVRSPDLHAPGWLPRVLLDLWGIRSLGIVVKASESQAKLSRLQRSDIIKVVKNEKKMSTRVKVYFKPNAGQRQAPREASTTMKQVVDEVEVALDSSVTVEKATSWKCTLAEVCGTENFEDFFNGMSDYMEEHSGEVKAYGHVYGDYADTTETSNDDEKTHTEVASALAASHGDAIGRLMTHTHSFQELLTQDALPEVAQPEEVKGVDDYGGEAAAPEKGMEPVDTGTVDADEDDDMPDDVVMLNWFSRLLEVQLCYKVGYDGLALEAFARACVHVKLYHITAQRKKRPVRTTVHTLANLWSEDRGIKRSTDVVADSKGLKTFVDNACNQFRIKGAILNFMKELVAVGGANANLAVAEATSFSGNLPHEVSGVVEAHHSFDALAKVAETLKKQGRFEHGLLELTACMGRADKARHHVEHAALDRIMLMPPPAHERKLLGRHGPVHGELVELRQLPEPVKLEEERDRRVAPQHPRHEARTREPERRRPSDLLVAEAQAPDQ